MKTFCLSFTRIIFVVILLFTSVNTYSQIDDLFWFAMPEITPQHGGSEPTFLRISGVSDQVYGDHVIVDMPATGLVLYDGFVAVGATYNLDLTNLIQQAYGPNWVSPEPHNNILESGQFGTEGVVQNRGIRIRSLGTNALDTENDISVYCDRTSSNNKDIWVLKGRNGLGTAFTVPMQNIWPNVNYGSEPMALSGFDVVATKAGTTITINTKAPFRLAGGNLTFYAANVNHSFQLDVGQTFAVVAADRLVNSHFGGSKVTSNEPIALTWRDDSVRPIGQGYDVTGDQIIPDDLAGFEYIVLRGELAANSATTKKCKEYAFVMATENNTVITSNSIYGMLTTTPDVNATFHASTTNTLNAGQIGRFLMNAKNHNDGIAGTHPTRTNIDALYIQADKPVIVFHITGFGDEVGGAVVPSIDMCTGSKNVSIVRNNAAMNFYINLMTRTYYKDSIRIEIGGISYPLDETNFDSIASDWWVMRKPLNDFTTAASSPIGVAVPTGSPIKVISPGRFHLGTIEGDGSGCKYGYFSSFSADSGSVSVGGDENIAARYCWGDTIRLKAKGANYYKWWYGGNPADNHEFITDSTLSKPLAILKPSASIKQNYLVRIVKDCYTTTPIDTLGVQVTVYEKVVADFDTLPQSPNCCSPTDYKFDNISQNLVNYQWTIPRETDTIISTQREYLNTVSFTNHSNVPVIYNVELAANKSMVCFDTIIIPIKINPQITASGLTTNITCFGESTGAIELTVSGGSAPYSYSWSNASVLKDQTSLVAGVYSVTITDANSCNLMKEFTIAQPISALSATGIATPIKCFGEQNGAISLTVAGGTAPYSYSWSSGSILKDQVGLATGIYSVTITDANSCSFIKEFTIVQSISALSATGIATPINCFGESTGAIELTVSGGTSPYSYNWSNGSVLKDQTSLVAGVYSVTITDANSCNLMKEFTIVQPISALSATGIATPINCFGESTGAISLTVAGGTSPYSYNWSNGSILKDQTSLVAGVYSVTITDANSCNLMKEFTIAQPISALSATGIATPIKCFGEQNGTITLTVAGGTAPYSYSWSSGSILKDQVGLATGIYSVTITDANSCSFIKEFTIVQSISALSATGIATPINCFGESTGAISLTVAGGTSPYSYNWSNGSILKDQTSLVAGVYSVTITDANSCNLMKEFTIVQPISALSATGIATPIKCFGEQNGAISLTVAGGTAPYSYSWSNGSILKDQVGLAMGIYSVTIADANSCNLIKEFTLTQPASALSATGIPTPVNCYGESSGAIAITVTGGTLPFAYNWSNGSVLKDQANLSAGVYSVTITDANSCNLVKEFTLTQPASPLSATGIPTPVNCYSESTGAISLTVTGGTSPYSYNWSNGSVLKDQSGLAAGTYSVTITDANQCINVSKVVVYEESKASLKGVAKFSGGYIEADDATVYLYNFQDKSHKPIADVIMQNFGIFEFADIPDGQYIVYVKLADHAKQKYKGVNHTYYNQTFKWNEATIFDLTCGDSSSIVIDMVENQKSIYGQGIVSGKVIKNNGGSKDRYYPLEKVDILLINGLSGIPVASAVTDTNGNYVIKGIGEGYYFLYIDITGISQNSTYTFSITENSSEFTNMNFEVDMDVTFEYNTIVLSETNIELTESQFEMVAYPNPANNYIILSSDFIKNKTVRITLLSKSGAVICAQKADTQETAHGEVNFEISNIPAGAYIIKIECEEYQSIKNIIVID